jgi:N-acetylmuramoyl-L-alanine amidase
MVVSTALLCLALNVYHEARSEPVMGQYAVAMVTLNRARGDQSRVCAEVFKPFQFSWANSRVVKTKGGWLIPQGLQPSEEVAWDKAQRIAAATLQGRMIDVTLGSTYYHTRDVKPAWRKAFEWTRSIGAHVFYREPLVSQN